MSCWSAERKKAFGYDNIDRLTSVADAVNGNESYAFDGVGNRTASHLSNTYTHQPFNRLTATEMGSYSHDANGNTVSKVEGSKRWTYSWDYENRLTQAWDRKTRVRYQYDALGRRVERNLGFGRERTKFTYDGEDVLLDDANGTQTKYLNGLGIDNKLSLKTGSAVSYFLADHLGSTNGLADATGSLTAQTGYDAFGNATAAAFPTRYQFTGREYDQLTGLYHYRNRYYDAKLGRFISEDPIGFAGGDVNLYGYVRNRVTLFKDPLGLDDADQEFYKRLPPGWDRGFSTEDLGKPPFLRCGPTPDNPLEWLVPDRIGGPQGYFGSMFNFNPACQRHDICYGTCGTNQEACDLGFRDDLLAECNNGGQEREPYRSQCRDYAEIYYRAVSDRWWIGRSLYPFGKKAFDAAQKGSRCGESCEERK